jgi:hypothetical protein
MTTDSEIIKNWDEIHRQEYTGKPKYDYLHDKAIAIRLWRMAEKENEVFCQICKCGIPHIPRETFGVCNTCLNSQIDAAESEAEKAIAEASATGYHEGIEDAKYLPNTPVGDLATREEPAGSSVRPTSAEVERTRASVAASFVKEAAAQESGTKQITFTDEMVEKVALKLAQEYFEGDGADDITAREQARRNVIDDGKDIWLKEARSLLQSCGFKSEEKVRKDAQKTVVEEYFKNAEKYKELLHNEIIASWLESEEDVGNNTAGQFEGISNYANPYKINEAKAFLRKACAAKLREKRD